MRQSSREGRARKGTDTLLGGSGQHIAHPREYVQRSHSHDQEEDERGHQGDQGVGRAHVLACGHAREGGGQCEGSSTHRTTNWRLTADPGPCRARCGDGYGRQGEEGHKDLEQGAVSREVLEVLERCEGDEGRSALHVSLSPASGNGPTDAQDDAAQATAHEGADELIPCTRESEDERAGGSVNAVAQEAGLNPWRRTTGRSTCLRVLPDSSISGMASRFHKVRSSEWREEQEEGAGGAARAGCLGASGDFEPASRRWPRHDQSRVTRASEGRPPAE